jgi:hypothetical protein
MDTFHIKCISIINEIKGQKELSNLYPKISLEKRPKLKIAPE